jgi:hypothetical protein
MKARLMFVPPDGGEIDYSLDFELPAVPRPGDYITIARKGAKSVGSEDFIVRRTWWYLEYPDEDSYHDKQSQVTGRTVDIGVECEFAHGAYSSDSHKRACDMYTSRGKSVKEFDNSAY